MINNYEKAEIVEIGGAHDVILGAKTFGDADSETDPRPQILVQDDEE